MKSTYTLHTTIISKLITATQRKIRLRLFFLNNIIFLILKSKMFVILTTLVFSVRPGLARDIYKYKNANGRPWGTINNSIYSDGSLLKNF